MSTVLKRPDGSFVIYTKGASEIVMRKCTQVLDNKGNSIPFGPKDRENMMNKVISPFADDALRTIGLCYKEIPTGQAIDWEDESQVISGLTLIGVVGIEDPVRPEVPVMARNISQLMFKWLLFCHYVPKPL